MKEQRKTEELKKVKKEVTEHRKESDKTNKLISEMKTRIQEPINITLIGF